MKRRNSRVNTSSTKDSSNNKLKLVDEAVESKDNEHCNSECCDLEHGHKHENKIRRIEFDNALKSNILFADSASKLVQIQQNNVQLVVFQKKRADFRRILSKQSLPISSLPTFEGLVTPYDVNERLTSFLCPRYPLRSKKSKALNDEQMEQFICEISELVQIFSKISDSEFVFVKLHVILDDGCAFWHQDSVTYRLVETYRGPCSEYVLPQYSMKTLQHRKEDSPHAISLMHGDVALFKGRGETTVDDEFLNQEGIVHRSPRVKEDSGISRLVLILDIPQEGWHY